MSEVLEARSDAQLTSSHSGSLNGVIDVPGD